MTTQTNLNLDDVTARIVRVLALATSNEGRQGLDALEQRLSVELYRLLAEGQPVPRATLAERVGISVEAVNHTLDRWPGVFSDAERRVVGYWGLALSAAYASPHRFTFNGQTFSAWCAWDTLFLPHLLSRTAEVESTTPVDGTIVRLTVTPERVERVDPAGACMSFLVPDVDSVQRDVATTFCHFIYFFPSREAGETWAAAHTGTFLLSVADAHSVGLQKNRGLYPELFA